MTEPLPPEAIARVVAKLAADTREEVLLQMLTALMGIPPPSLGAVGKHLHLAMRPADRRPPGLLHHEAADVYLDGQLVGYFDLRVAPTRTGMAVLTKGGVREQHARNLQGGTLGPWEP